MARELWSEGKLHIKAVPCAGSLASLILGSAVLVEPATLAWNMIVMTVASFKFSRLEVVFTAIFICGNSALVAFIFLEFNQAIDTHTLII